MTFGGGGAALPTGAPLPCGLNSLDTGNGYSSSFSGCVAMAVRSGHHVIHCFSSIRGCFIFLVPVLMCRDGTRAFFQYAQHW